MKITERVNRVWIALIDGFTEENGQNIHHMARMVKFNLPESEGGKTLTNDRETAEWFYLNHLDLFSTMSDDRMINASDLPEAIVQLIPYKSDLRFNKDIF
jgi:hypothetical protein